jgi:hypothetical protein
MACRPVVVGVFPYEKEAIAVELEEQLHETSWMLIFPLSMISPSAYSTHRNVIWSLLYFKCM